MRPWTRPVARDLPPPDCCPQRCRKQQRAAGTRPPGHSRAALCCRPRLCEGRYNSSRRLPRTPHPVQHSQQGGALLNPRNVCSMLITGVDLDVYGKHKSNLRQRLRGTPSSCITQPLSQWVMTGRWRLQGPEQGRAMPRPRGAAGCIVFRAVSVCSGPMTEQVDESASLPHASGLVRASRGASGQKEVCTLPRSRAQGQPRRCI